MKPRIAKEYENEALRKPIPSDRYATDTLSWVGVAGLSWREVRNEMNQLGRRTFLSPLY